MYIKINRKKLSSSLQKGFSIINKKSPLSAITNYKIQSYDGGIYIASTNMETLIVQKVPCKVEEEGKVLVNATLLNNLIKQSISEEVSLKIQDNYLHVIDGKDIFKIFLSKEDFPNYEVEGFEEIIKINYDILCKSLKEIKIKVDNDFGIFTIDITNEHVILISNDKRRMSLSFINEEHNLQKKISMSPKFISDIPKLFEGDITFLIKGNRICMSNEDINVYTRSCEGFWVDYKRIIKNIDSYNQYSFPTNKLKGALSRVLTVSSALTRSVKLVFKSDSVDLSCFDPSAGSANVSVEGKTIHKFQDTDTMVVNGEFLLEALECSSTDESQVFFALRNQPLIIDCGATHIIMPIRN